MSKKLIYISSTISLVTITLFSIQNFNNNSTIVTESERVEYENFLNEHPFNNKKYTETELKAIPKKDRPDLAWEQNYLATMNPILRRPEVEKLFQYTFCY